MNLTSDRELSVTREKLAALEARYAELLAEESDDEELRELTIESVKRTITQLTENITRYQLRAHSGRRAEPGARATG